MRIKGFVFFINIVLGAALLCVFCYKFGARLEPDVERSCEMTRDIPRVVRALSPDNINHPKPLDKPVYIVTPFHTHPWEFGHTVEKHVGPRGRRRGDIVGDVQNADTRQLSAFIYDYDDSAGIKAPPFDINAATKSCIHGPERRPLP